MAVSRTLRSTIVIGVAYAVASGVILTIYFQRVRGPEGIWLGLASGAGLGLLGALAYYGVKRLEAKMAEKIPAGEYDAVLATRRSPKRASARVGAITFAFLRALDWAATGSSLFGDWRKIGIAIAASVVVAVLAHAVMRRWPSILQANAETAIDGEPESPSP